MPMGRPEKAPAAEDSPAPAALVDTEPPPAAARRDKLSKSKFNRHSSTVKNRNAQPASTVGQETDKSDAHLEHVSFSREPQSSTDTVFVHSPFRNLHEYWDDPDQPNQITGEWLTESRIKSTDDALAAGLQQGIYVPTVGGKVRVWTRMCVQHSNMNLAAC